MPSIPLAELLSQRAEMQSALSRLSARLLAAARNIKDEPPTEDPRALFEEAEQLHNRLFSVIQAINHANLVARLDDGTLLADAIVKRDILSRRIALLRSVAQAASNTDECRHTMRGTLLTVPAVDIQALHTQAEELAQACRHLDNQIQRTNWKYEVNRD